MFNFLNLKSGVGEGEENREEDVKSLSKSLSDLGDNEVQGDGWSKNGFVSKPLFDGVRRLQEKNDAKVDGIVRPKGETEQIVNNGLAGKPRGAGLFDNLPGPLSDSVGAGGANRGADVSSVKRSLGALGHIAEDPFDQPNGIMTAKTDQAIRQFQREKRLKEDGLLYAQGPTERALDADVTRLSDEERAKWKRFHEKVAVYNQTHSRPLFPEQKSGAEGDGVVSARVLLRRGNGSGVPGAGPGHRPLPPFNRDNWIMTPKGPLPNLFKGLEGLFGGSRKPVPGRKPTKLPPPAMKGPDPSQKRDDYRGTSKPGQAPKLPEKTELIPPKPVTGNIEIYPDHSDILGRPLIIVTRLGSESTRELNRKIASTIRETGSIKTNITVEQVGGPRPGSTTEHYIANPDNKDKSPKSTKGSSYVDITFKITGKYKGEEIVVWLHVDTYTARKSDGKPVPREERQHVRLKYNEEGNALIARIPKPLKGEGLAHRNFEKWVDGLLDRIDKGIARGEFGPDGSAKKVVRFFKMKTPR